MEISQMTDSMLDLCIITGNSLAIWIKQCSFATNKVGKAAKTIQFWVGKAVKKLSFWLEKRQEGLFLYLNYSLLCR